MAPRVKICCMASTKEAVCAAAAGADLVGLVGPMPSGAGVIGLDTAREIAEAAPAWVSPVLLTQAETTDEIAAEVTATGVRAVQLVRHVAPTVHHELAERLPWLRRIQVVHIESEQSVDHADLYEGLVDAFLLDSGRPAHAELGGTGRVHDWSVSAAFVRRTKVPVFLAGGLKPDNVACAIAEVRPFGVDVCTGVRDQDRLDQDQLIAFMAAVHAAGTEPRAGHAP